MKILFLSDNYPPEVNAPATRTHEHCRRWVNAGHDVTVVTCAPNFPTGEVFAGYQNRLYQAEVLDGVHVVRVWSYMTENAGFVRRIADYVSYAVTATMSGLFRDFDVLVATSPQFFTAVAGSVVAGVRGRPWVFELRDFWPESIVATGAMRRGVAIRALEAVEVALYRSADLVVPVTESFKRQLVDRGIDESKIRVVTNGIVAAEYSLPPVEDTAASRDRPFRVGYLGTHGLAHGLDLVLRAARLVQPAEVEFVLIGDGAEKRELELEAARLELPHVVFRDPIPRDGVPEALASFDACLVPLRDTETFRAVIPSKIFEAAAARRPILLGVRGEAQQIVDEHDAGLTFAPEDESELVDRIQRLRSDRDLYERLQAGADRLASAFDRDTLAQRMLTHLETLA